MSVQRFLQVVFIVVSLALAWLLMMAVHESGHVLHAWLSGGRVARVVLDPREFSRTDLALNPHPLFVVIGGPLWGCLLPLLLYAVLRWRKVSGWYLARFFAGFCFIANGVYIGAGGLVGAGDAGDLLNEGAPLWGLIASGAAAFAAGLFLWHGLGRHFGFPLDGNAIRRTTLLRMAAALVVILAVEMLLLR